MMQKKRIAYVVLCVCAVLLLFFWSGSYQVIAGRTSIANIGVGHGSVSNEAGDSHKYVILAREYLDHFINTIMNVHYNFFPGYIDGNDVPPNAVALSMAGKRRLDNFAMAVSTVVGDGIPGDIIETGSWRGGASFVAVKVVELLAGQQRKVFICDSFKGIPKPPNDRQYSTEDQNANFPVFSDLSVERLVTDAQHLGLKTDSYQVVKGYFNESLPALLADQPHLIFSVLRLDGDTYFSTMDALRHLYPRLQPGGIVIVDDFIDWAGCRLAVDHYRAEHGISEPIMLVPHRKGEILRGAYWRKGHRPQLHRERDSGAQVVKVQAGGVRSQRLDSSWLCLLGEDRALSSDGPGHGGGASKSSSAEGTRTGPWLYPASAYRPAVAQWVPPEGPAGLVFDPQVFTNRTDIAICS